MVTFIDDDDIELKPCPFCNSTAAISTPKESIPYVDSLFGGRDEQ